MKRIDEIEGSGGNTGSESLAKCAERPSVRCSPTTKPARAKSGEAPSPLPKGQPCNASPLTEFMRQVDANPLVRDIVEKYRERRQYMRAIQRLEQQMLSICVGECARSGHTIVDAASRSKAWKAADQLMKKVRSEIKKPGSEPTLRNDLVLMLRGFETACGPLAELRHESERQLERLAKKLPVWRWVEDVRGFGALGLEIVVGEAGDLSAYRTKSKLWKRLGLAVVNGERQRMCSDTDRAAVHGYSPERRSAIWTIADSMFRHQIRSVKDEHGQKVGDSIAAGPYGERYLAAKASEFEKNPTISKAWADKRARRKMEKKLIADLRAEWRRCDPRRFPSKWKDAVVMTEGIQESAA
jgi:hypothetical protein